MNGIFKIQNIYFKGAGESLNLLKLIYEQFNNQETFERCLFTVENGFNQYKAQMIC